MDKNDFGGIEVRSEPLLVAWRREELTLPVKPFPNTAKGHRAGARYLARKGRGVRVCLESTGVYGLDLAARLQIKAGIEVMVANPRAVRRRNTDCKNGLITNNCLTSLPRRRCR